MRIIRQSAFSREWVGTVFAPFFVVFLISLGLCFFGFKQFRLTKNKPADKKPIISRQKNISKDKMKEALEVVSGLYIDPFTLTKVIDSDPAEIVLIDLRAKEEYAKGHIKSSVNYSIERMIKDLNTFKHRQIVLYGQNSNDPLPREAALEVLGKGFDVKLLSVGWTEFRHFRNLWVPESKWDETDIDRYIDSAL